MNATEQRAALPMLAGTRHRAGERATYNLTRAGGKMLGACGLPTALACAAVVFACNVSIAAMSGWREAQQAVLDPQPSRRAAPRRSTAEVTP